MSSRAACGGWDPAAVTSPRIPDEPEVEEAGRLCRVLEPPPLFAAAVMASQTQASGPLAGTSPRCPPCRSPPAAELKYDGLAGRSLSRRRVMTTVKRSRVRRYGEAILVTRLPALSSASSGRPRLVRRSCSSSLASLGSVSEARLCEVLGAAAGRQASFGREEGHAHL